MLGAKVVTASDSSGYVYDKDGIDVALLKQVKEQERARIVRYTELKPTAKFVPGKRVWEVPCDVALPCATQNELSLDDTKELIKNGCIAVGEGANMPSTIDATNAFLQSKVLFAPAKAANAGGVATSALEMSQNSARMIWTFDEVDEKTQGYYGEHLRPHGKCRKRVQHPRRLCCRRKHCRFLKGSRRDDGTGYSIIYTQKPTGATVLAECL